MQRSENRLSRWYDYGAMLLDVNERGSERQTVMVTVQELTKGAYDSLAALNEALYGGQWSATDTYRAKSHLIDAGKCLLSAVPTRHDAPLLNT